MSRSFVEERVELTFCHLFFLSSVTEFKVGDRAGVGAQVGSCGNCAPCKSDNENYCVGDGKKGMGELSCCDLFTFLLLLAPER